MSARKIEGSSLLGSTTQQSQCLTLPEETVHIRKSGIEFRSDQPLVPWTEMTVSLQIPRQARKVNCTGVVIACSGNRKRGYQISMVFTDLSNQSQARLSTLAAVRA